MIEIETAKLEQRRQLAEKIGGMLPIVANRIAKDEIVPGANPRDQILADLASSLSEKQIAAIAIALTDVQRMQLGELLRAARARAAAQPDEPPNGKSSS